MATKKQQESNVAVMDPPAMTAGTISQMTAGTADQSTVYSQQSTPEQWAAYYQQLAQQQAQQQSGQQILYIPQPPLIPAQQPAPPPEVTPLAAPSANVSTTTVTTPATHFSGPVSSGLVGVGQNGFAVLCKRWDFDVTKGPIPANITVNLPPSPASNSLLLDCRRLVTTATDTVLNLTIGSTLNGTDLMALQTINLAGNSAPVQIVPLSPTPKTFYLNFANATTPPTVGKFSVLVIYART